MLRLINSWIFRVEIVVGTSMLAVATSAIILQVFFRYFLRMPFSWPEELATFLLSWITFLGASILIKHNGHIRVSILLDRLPHPARRMANIFLDLTMVMALALMIHYGIESFYIQNVSRTVALHIPKGYFSLPLILASFSMLSFLVQDMWELISMKKEV